MRGARRCGRNQPYPAEALQAGVQMVSERHPSGVALAGEGRSIPLNSVSFGISRRRTRSEDGKSPNRTDEAGEHQWRNWNIRELRWLGGTRCFR